ncbi:hypothetical protein [Methyloligella solikamskensis]|uniref:Uncharacterized protein n=1 Tax=Methyloligella solikamskensis TaxID=1177756 RepID=A0ABW3J6L6_9HYPH
MRSVPASPGIGFSMLRSSLLQRLTIAVSALLVVWGAVLWVVT